MPFKLIGTIILLVIVTIFAGFNLEEANRCDINLVFHTLKNIPVFLTVLTSFFAGVLVMVPFALFRKKMSKEEIAMAAEKQKLNDEKAAAKAEKARIKAEQKEKTLAEKAEKKAAKTAAGEGTEEKTIFDFKIRRSVDKKTSEDQTKKE